MTASPYVSPWTRREKFVLFLWEAVWATFCRWTPKPWNGWRLFWLRSFGARIHGQPFVHQRSRVAVPWNLEMHPFSCLGDGANAYSLGPIEIGPYATIAQEVYLCTGTHRFDLREMPLVTGAIRVGADAFVGARAFVLPSVVIGEGAVVGACAVVTKDVEAGSVVAGNPAKVIRRGAGSRG